jgi:hypothetical protein
MLRISKGYMEDQRLLASAALFRQLHDNKKDVYDVLGQFIRSSIMLNSTWSFNITECATDLEKDFGFKIPEAVIRTCLKKRLKKDGELSQTNGIYSVTPKFDRTGNLEAEYLEVQHEQKFILNKLIDYVKNCTGHDLDASQKRVLTANFYAYLLGELRACDNALYISQFIVKNSDDHGFTKKLNRVEEGLILYGGICHSSDLANHEPWKNNFTIFLDTEILFCAQGFNGELHEKIFGEFHELIKEVSGRTVRDAKIELRYFDETKREIDDFFYAAERIVEQHQQPDPSKQAMLHIVNGCKSAADVMLKKANFYDALRRLRINPETECDYYNPPTYIVESVSAVNTVKKGNPEFDEEKIAGVLKLFTKINYMRNGVNNRGLEQSGAILVSGKNITRSIAFSEAVYSESKQIPFATDVDFLTERVWFKLNKGFGDGSKLPISFDIVARAQVILSTQAGNKVGEEYRALKSKVDAGQMSMESAGYLVSELRSRTVKPEDFSPENVDETVSFMHSDFIEDTLRQKSLLERKVQEGEKTKSQVEMLQSRLDYEGERSKFQVEELQSQLAHAGEQSRRQLKALEIRFHKERLKTNRDAAKKEYMLIMFCCYSLPIAMTAALLYFLYSPADTTLSIFSAITGLIPLILPLLGGKYFKLYAAKVILARYRTKVKSQYYQAVAEAR